MFQTCFPNQKVQRKKNTITFLKPFLNAMTMNIKFYLLIDIIKLSNINTHDLINVLTICLMNFCIQMYIIFFKSSMGIIK
jgi:hypothetical protein